MASNVKQVPNSVRLAVLSHRHENADALKTEELYHGKALSQVAAHEKHMEFYKRIIADADEFLAANPEVPSGNEEKQA